MTQGKFRPPTRHRVKTLSLRCACGDVQNPSGAALWISGPPAFDFATTEAFFTKNHQGPDCKIERKEGH